MRSVPLWIGKTDDAPIPPRVKLRVFERHNGICHLTGRKIMAGEAWDCDHIIALANGGTHSEDNLAPALREPHKEKTKADVREKAKVASIRKKHLGITRPRKKIASRPFPRSDRKRALWMRVQQEEPME